MRKFKVAFEVLDITDNLPGVVVVEKQQTIIELSEADLKGPDLPVAMTRELERKRGAPESEVDQTEIAAAHRVREFCTAAGMSVGRFVEVKLREWARGRPIS